MELPLGQDTAAAIEKNPAWGEDGKWLVAEV
jgi:hypothetical protein